MKLAANCRAESGSPRNCFRLFQDIVKDGMVWWTLWGLSKSLLLVEVGWINCVECVMARVERVR